MKVELDLMETGYLCNLIMARLMAADKTEKVPTWITELYIKLADANDKLMGKKEDAELNQYFVNDDPKGTSE